VFVVSSRVSVVVHKNELRLRMRGFSQALRYRTRLPPECAPIGTSNAARTLILLLLSIALAAVAAAAAVLCALQPNCM
jgi:hypothetical protein